MTDLRIRRKYFNISIFNIKISPKRENEDFTEMYSNMIRRVHSENIAVNTRGDKFMELRTLNSYFENGVQILYGKITYYTVLDTKDWYNKRLKTIETVELDSELNPNAKEIEYFFIPSAHRFCFITKQTGIAMSQIELFLKGALPRVVSENKEVIITKELTNDIIERILNAPILYRLEIGLSYSNHDLTEEFEKEFDDENRESHIQHLNLIAKSFKSEAININNNRVFKAALKLSQSNGYAEATIQNESGKNEKIATIEYPRKELVLSSEGNEHKDVLTKIISLFRNG
jgi:hypothetical protein